VLDDDLNGQRAVPETLIDFASATTAGGLGNLQHCASSSVGAHPVSRINLLSGAMSYLSAPIWLRVMARGSRRTAAATPRLSGDTAAVCSTNPRAIILAIRSACLLPKLMAW